MAKVISVTGGKTGVGATFVGLNTAASLASMGHRTCLLFADPERSPDSLPFDLSSAGDFSAVLSGDCSLKDAIISGMENLDVMIAGDALEDGECILPEQAKRLSDSFYHAADYDFLIITTPPSPSESTLSLMTVASASILVFTPEPPTITAAYSLIKALGSRGFKGRLGAVVNQSKNRKVSDLAVAKLNESVGKSFDITLSLLAHIPKDPAVSRSTTARRVFIEQAREAGPAKDIQLIAQSLLTDGATDKGQVKLDDFWKAYFTECMTDASGEADARGKETETVAPSRRIDGPEPVSMDIENTPSPNDTGLDLDTFRPNEGDSSTLGAVANSLNSLTMELRAIKNLLQRRNFQSANGNPDSPLQEKIELDFNSFLFSRVK